MDAGDFVPDGVTKNYNMREHTALATATGCVSGARPRDRRRSLARSPGAEPHELVALKASTIQSPTTVAWKVPSGVEEAMRVATGLWAIVTRAHGIPAVDSSARIADVWFCETA